MKTNEPAQPNQHPVDEQRPDHCPACAGKGFEFVQIGIARRQQIPCARCGGSGGWVDGVARTLSGEAESGQVGIDKIKAASKVRFWSKFR